MVEFLLNIGDPSGKTEHKQISDAEASTMIGLAIGDIVDGANIGHPGEKFRITGGSDRDGFPMRKDLPGTDRKRVYVSEGVGFKPKRHGERMRKRMRGDTIADDIYQINMSRITAEAEA